MKKLNKIAILFVVLFMITGCKKEYIHEIDYQEYHQLLDQKETFILEIMRTDCPNCQEFSPKLEQVAEQYKIEIQYINTDHLKEEIKNQLYKETGISGTPTVIFYRDGMENTIQSRINGNVSIEKIISKMKASGFIPEEKTSN